MQLLRLLPTTFALAAKTLDPRQTSSSSSTTTKYTLSLNETDTINLLTYIRHISHDLFQLGCDTFSEGDWVAGGLSHLTAANICLMADQSTAHVDSLNDILRTNGAPKIEPCSYTFVYSEPTSYISLVNEVLSWSVSAYLGALPSLTANPSLLTLTASQLTVLSRHAGSIRTIYATNPAPSNLETPLPPAWSYNIAQPYIASCSHALGYSVLPRLNVSDVAWKDNQNVSSPGETNITLSYDPTTFWTPQQEGTTLYLALANQGYDPLMVGIEEVGREGNVVIAEATIPSEMSGGVVFAALTTFQSGLKVGDLVEFGTLAGPAEIVVS